MGIQLLLRRRIYKDGVLLKDFGYLKSHSFVRQFLDLLAVWIDHLWNVNGSIISVTDVTPAARNMQSSAVCTGAQMLATQAPVNTQTYGIVVGSGFAAESNSDSALQTQITHGGGGGQLNYGACGLTRAAVVGANVDGVVTRSFTNASGGDVTVREIGIYVTSRDTGLTQRYFCIVRDVLVAADVVPNGGTYTVEYTVRTTV